MYRITNNSGAHLPLDNGLNLGPHRSITVKSIPRALSRIQRFVTIERVLAAVQKPTPVLQTEPISQPIEPTSQPAASSESSEFKTPKRSRKLFDTAPKGEN